MENFDIARKAMETAMNSQGSAMAEHEKWLNSLEAKTQQFKAAWEGLSQSFMNSSFLKGLVGTGTNFLSVLTKIIDKIGALPAIVAVAAGALSLKHVGIFKSVELEGNTLIQNMKSTLLGGFNGIFGSLKQSAKDFKFSDGFSQSLRDDEKALVNYRNALKSGVDEHKAFNDTMTEASIAAQDFSQNNKVTLRSIKDFATAQKESQVALQAQNKSFANCRALITEYNSNCKTCGLTQEQFKDAIQQSNPALANYLSGLNSAKGSLGGYIGSLISAKAATLAMEAATMALNMATTMLISAGIQAVIKGLDYLIHYEEKASEKANEIAQASKEKSDASKEEASRLSELIAKYKELAESDTQDVGTRQEIKSVQDEITNLVGGQASNLDLVNGKLDTELNKLDEIKKKQAETNLQNATVAYSDAVDAANKAIADSKGNWLLDGGGWYDYAGAIEEEAAQIIWKAYPNANPLSRQYVDTPDDMTLATGGMFGTRMYAYAGEDMSIFEKISALDEWINLLENTAGFKYADSEFYKTLVKQRNSYQEYAKAITESNNTIIDSTLALSGADKDLKKITVNSADSLEKYREKLVDIVKNSPNLADALSSGNLTEEDIEERVNSYLGTLSEFSEYYDEWLKSFEQTETANKLKNAFLSAFDEKDTDRPAVRKKIQEFNQWIDSLSAEDREIVYKISCDTDTAKYSLEDWKNALAEYSEATEISLTQIETATKNAEEKTKGVVDNISNIQSIIAAQSGGNSLSFEDFDSAGLKDYTEALEYNNGALQLNAEKVRKLVEEKAKLTIATNNEQKAEAQSLYLQNAAKIEQYRRQLEKAGGANSKNREAIEASIDALVEQNGTLRDSIAEYDLMNAALREATDAYHNWLNAQNASDYGDMFDDALSAIQRINDTFNEESDIFGDFGSQKFSAAVEFIIPDSVDRDDTSAIESYIKNLKRYFVFDDDDNNLGMDIEKFCQSAVNKGLMVLDKSTDEYQLKGKMTIEKFAEGMNMSAGMVQAFFDELKLKGGDFSWADEGIKTIGDLGVAATEAAEKLRNTKEYSKLKIRLDVSEIDGTQKKIDTLNATINEAKKIKVDSSEVEDANNIIAYCVAQKQLLTEPIVMSVDVSKVEGKAQDVIEKIQEFQNAWNELSSLKQQIGVDTSEAQKNVNDLAKQIKSLPEKTIKALNIDPTSVQTIEQSINNITAKELTVGLKIDQSAILGYEADSKTAKVVYGVDDSDVQAYKRRNDDKKATEIYKVDSSEVAKYKKQNDDKYPNAIYHRVSTEVDTYNPPNLTRTVTYKKVVVDDSSGSTQLNGTAHAGGDWGTAKGGRTLVGELGRKILRPYMATYK